MLFLLMSCKWIKMNIQHKISVVARGGGQGEGNWPWAPRLETPSGARAENNLFNFITYTLYTSMHIYIVYIASLRSRRFWGAGAESGGPYMWIWEQRGRTGSPSTLPHPQPLQPATQATDNKQLSTAFGVKTFHALNSVRIAQSMKTICNHRNSTFSLSAIEFPSFHTYLGKYRNIPRIPEQFLPTARHVLYTR